MPVTAYADFCARIGEADLPAPVLHAARRALVDWYGCTLAGSVQAPATLLRIAVQGDGDGRARLLPDGRASGVRSAALINGTAAHTIEFDDIYSPGLYHPGAPIISAALAMAEHQQCSGAELLRAIVAGYEVSNRIAQAVVPSHYRYWHTTATVGCFGAAAACACLLKLTAAQIRDAINLSVSMAAGLQQAFRSGSMAKPLHSGRAAETGVLCALSAAQGISGAQAMLDGEFGFGQAMSRDVDWSGAITGLGTDFTICRMTQKNHGCCGHTFAALDGLIHLRNEYSLNPQQVRSVVIGSYAAALRVCAHPDPQDAAQARFSLAYCAAVALHDGQVRLAAFADERLSDPQLRATMRKIKLSLDDRAEAVFPRKRAAQVQIRTVDGTQLEHFIASRKGDPDWPLGDEELNAKFVELTAPLQPSSTAQDILDRLWHIDELENVQNLPCYCRAG